MPDRITQEEFDSFVERFAKQEGLIDPDGMLDDYTIVGSSISLELISKTKHSYFMTSRNGGIALHRTVGLLQVGMDRCGEWDDDDDD
jgi:hypothetical protein